MSFSKITKKGRIVINLFKICHISRFFPAELLLVPIKQNWNVDLLNIYATIINQF